MGACGLLRGQCLLRRQDLCKASGKRAPCPLAARIYLHCCLWARSSAQRAGRVLLCGVAEAACHYGGGGACRRAHVGQAVHMANSMADIDSAAYSAGFMHALCTVSCPHVQREAANATASIPNTPRRGAARSFTRESFAPGLACVTCCGKVLHLSSRLAGVCSPERGDKIFGDSGTDPVVPTVKPLLPLMDCMKCLWVQPSRAKVGRSSCRTFCDLHARISKTSRRGHFR